MEKTAIVRLSEAVQENTGENIVTRVIGKTGADHQPSVSVEIKLPDGDVYTAAGKNKKEAKNKAAIEALKVLEVAGWI